jgi:hypothetical protein
VAARWLRYFALGGTGSIQALERYRQGEAGLDDGSTTTWPSP